MKWMKTSGKIALICPDYALPSGGVRVIYRHADILNRAGFEAYVVHGQPGFRCDWFENETPIRYASEVSATEFDLIVIPEIYGPRLHESVEFRKSGWLWNQLRRFGRLEKLTRWKWDVRGVAKVIFNQNAYLTFEGYGVNAAKSDSPYLSPEVKATLCVSEDSERYLRSVFPGLTLKRFFNSVDTRLFHPNEKKKKVISFATRKNPTHVVQVIEALKLRGLIEGYELIPLENLSEEEAGAVMRQSRFYLSFGYPEGCPCPPLEAMASGALVIGYHGNGGREYFDPRFSVAIAYGDIMGFVSEVERWVAKDRVEPRTIDIMGVQASEFVRERYTAAREERQVIEFYQSLFEAKKSEAA